MPGKTFKITIATPYGTFELPEVESVMARSPEGYFGILADHAPLMAALAVGALVYRDADGYEQLLAVSEGFLEVSKNVVTVIADAVEKKEEIDLERAQRALEKAIARLEAAATDPSIDIPRARAAYQRALNRIRIAKGEIKLR